MKRSVFRPYLLVAWAIYVVFASASGVDWTALMVYSMLAVPLSLLLGHHWPAKWRWNPRLLHAAVAVPLALVITVSVVWTSWPLRLHFIAAKPALERLASQVEQGRQVQTPAHVGLLRVQKAEKNHAGVVCVWVRNDSSGYSGFVKTQAGKVESQCNVSSTVTMDKDWQYVNED